MNENQSLSEHLSFACDHTVRSLSAIRTLQQVISRALLSTSCQNMGYNPTILNDNHKTKHTLPNPFLTIIHHFPYADNMYITLDHSLVMQVTQDTHDQLNTWNAWLRCCDIAGFIVNHSGNMMCPQPNCIHINCDIHLRRYVMALFVMKQNGCRFRMACIKCLVFSS